MSVTTTSDILDELIAWPESRVTFFYMSGYEELLIEARERGYILRLEPDPDDETTVTAWVEPRLPPE